MIEIDKLLKPGDGLTLVTQNHTYELEAIDPSNRDYYLLPGYRVSVPTKLFLRGDIEVGRGVQLIMKDGTGPVITTPVKQVILRIN